MSSVADYQLDSSIECGDGFGVKLYVRRPPHVASLIAELSDKPEAGGGFSPKERASCLLRHFCRDIESALRVQAAQLDPRTEEKKRECRKEFQRVFADAGFDAFFMEEIPNEYWRPEDPEFYSYPWYLVTTCAGHFKVGWRKRVVVLDWSRTLIKQDALELFPQEDVTREGRMIHAWSYSKLVEYLKILARVTIVA